MNNYNKSLTTALTLTKYQPVNLYWTHSIDWGISNNTIFLEVNLFPPISKLQTYWVSAQREQAFNLAGHKKWKWIKQKYCHYNNKQMPQDQSISNSNTVCVKHALDSG